MHITVAYNKLFKFLMFHSRKDVTTLFFNLIHFSRTCFSSFKRLECYVSWQSTLIAQSLKWTSSWPPFQQMVRMDRWTDKRRLVTSPPSTQRECAGENSERLLCVTTENETWIWLHEKADRSSGILVSLWDPSKKAKYHPTHYTIRI